MVTIKHKRLALGLTQANLAQQIGVTQGAVTQWENGLTNPSLETLTRIASVFQCTVDDLLNDSGDYKGGPTDAVL